MLNNSRLLVDPYVLVHAFPSRLAEEIADEKKCFRTEIRDTGSFICGVHMSGNSWRDAESACPDALELVRIAEYTLWNLITDLEHVSSEEEDPTGF